MITQTLKPIKIIYNNFIPFPGFSAMAFFGMIFARKGSYPLSEKSINHETIHMYQAKECGGWIMFYLKYLWFWPFYGYRKIPFEMEAFDNDQDLLYLETREKNAWKQYKK